MRCWATSPEHQTRNALLSYCVEPRQKKTAASAMEVSTPPAAANSELYDRRRRQLAMNYISKVWLPRGCYQTSPTPAAVLPLLAGTNAQRGHGPAVTWFHADNTTKTELNLYHILCFIVQSHDHSCIAPSSPPSSFFPTCDSPPYTSIYPFLENNIHHNHRSLPWESLRVR